MAKELGSCASGKNAEKVVIEDEGELDRRDSGGDWDRRAEYR